VRPDGKAVAVDLDLSLIDVRAPNLELRQDDIVAAPVDRRSFDLVTARAVLHHVANVEAAIGNLVASLRPDGAILLIEPDFLPVSVAKPPCTAARGTADQIYLGKKWQRVRESNPFRRFRDVAQFRHKYALGCALREKMQIGQFARFAQNYAVRVSDFVRKNF